MKRNWLKALVLFTLCLCIVFALASCKKDKDKGDDGDTPPECQHVDADDNALCDLCGVTFEDGQDVEPEPEPEPCVHVPGVPVTENRVEATCTVAGSYDEVIYCTISGCGTEISREAKSIPAAHTPSVPVSENTVAASCTVNGSYDEVVYCSVSGCGAEISREAKTLTAPGHTGGAAVIENTTLPSCTVNGSYDEVVYCSVAGCGAEVSRETKPIATPGHTAGAPVVENTVPASCFAPGSYDEVVYCTVSGCGGEVSRVNKPLTATGEHVPAAPVNENVVAATCLVDGSYDEVIYCTVDGCNCEISRESKTITSPGAHTPGEPVIENNILPTCTEDGSYDIVIYCSVSGCAAEISREHKTVTTAGHTRGDAYIANLTPATCTNGATYDEIVFCGVDGCHAEISRSTIVYSLPNGHSLERTVIENLVEATCIKRGSYDEVVYCGVCKAEITRLKHLTPMDYHTDENEDTECDVCGIAMTEVGEILPDVTWSNATTLIFQMTDDDISNELTSGCRRFLSGESGGQSAVEFAARTRNARAMKYANVDVQYAYYPDGTAGWGRKITDMWNAATSDTAARRPDIFCNIIYDMMSASLLKSFKNLYSDSYASVGLGSGDRRNYFSFAKDGKYDTTYVDTGDGYMIDYMQSFTLSEDKMYLLASDYFTDLVRAFFVVPVNVAMLESGAIPASNNPNDYNYDYNRNGAYDMTDFYQLVKEGRWTYDAVKYFSNAVYIEGGVTDNHYHSGRYGWAVAAGGLAASGLLYTTSVKIIEREVELVASTDPDNPGLVQQYTYWYPEQSKPLEDFTKALSDLFTSPGVLCVDDGARSKNDEIARDLFADNGALFGGIVVTGSLEDSIYGDMSADGGKGFGVVPVPLFRTSHEEIDENGETVVVNDRYLTAIHNIGRIGAIAIKSEKFAQCSAFLNYQSLNSSVLLDMYYNYTLKMDAAGAILGNSEMLDYIRENVRSTFDKHFEDAVSRHVSIGGGISMNNKKWHNVIRIYDYVLPVGVIEDRYEELSEMKDMYLQQLALSYANLPS